jgi:hypothetical protein
MGEKYKYLETIYATMAVKKFGLCVNENTYLGAKRVVESGKYRNMSHLFEEGAKRIIREEAAKVRDGE